MLWPSLAAGSLGVGTPGRRSRWVVGLLGALATLILLGAASRGDPRARLVRALGNSMHIVARDGTSLFTVASPEGEFREPVALEMISRWVVLATLSGEDANFYQHPGIDPIGVARALWLDAKAGRMLFGGSTLTQQLAKTISPEPRTLAGKIGEAFDALRLEWALDKDAILTEYLNRVYYGRGAYGIQAAARRYFDKTAMELTAGEAVLLAILPRAPSAYEPGRHLERALERRRHVVFTMAERGWIARSEAERVASEPVVLAKLDKPNRARHVVDALLTRTPRPLVVRTTLDVSLQERLEQAVSSHVQTLRQSDADQAGVVVIDNASGGVLAMVGSRRYGEAAVHGAVNVTTALRAPGSTLKPFVYALALQAGAGPSTAVLDLPVRTSDYRPRSSAGDFLGLVHYRDALGSSLNAPAVRLAEQVSPRAIAALLDRLGVRMPEGDHGLSIALGGVSARLVDLANAYATLARGGRFVPWTLVRGGSPGAVQVIDETTAYLVTDMLADAEARRRAFGLETPLDFPFAVAAKTGTSQAFCDNLTVGYTPEVTVAVWVGNFDGRPMRSLLAMEGAAPLFRDAMLAAMEGRSRRDFARPESVRDVEVCPLSGMKRGPHCPAGRREIVDDRHPPAECSWHRHDGVHVPAELLAFEDRARAVALPEEQVIAVASPAAGERFVIDPLLSRESQAITLRAVVSAPSATHIEWSVDGRRIAVGDPGAPVTWPLEAGRHEIAATVVFTDGLSTRRSSATPVPIVVEEI